MNLKNILFPSLESSAKIISLFTALGMILSFGMYFLKITDGQLKDLSLMAINTELVISALIIAVVSVGNTGSNKDIINTSIQSYIGAVLVVVSVGVFGFILSNVSTVFHLPLFIIKTYAVTMALFVNASVAESMKYLVRIFIVNK